jgi:hypothetical protein
MKRLPRQNCKNRLHTQIFALSIPLFMNRSFVQSFSTAFAFVALAGILAFGGGIRYFCYCAGTAVLTLHEHCHGDEGEHGPAHHAPVGHHHDQHGDHEQEDHDDHHHELVETSTDIRLPDVVTSPELRLLPLLWTALSEWETAWNPVSIAERPRLQIVEDPPPLSHQVARAVVRLI